MMRLDNTNFDAKKVQAGSNEITQSKLPEEGTKREKLDDEIQQSLVGPRSMKNAMELGAITPNERKELIKFYQEQGYSRQEAKALFDSKCANYDKMSRKEAKNWCKEYMKQTGCTKKEAKEAFKQEFGYSVPLSRLQSMVRMAGVLSNPIGLVAKVVDVISGGKLGVNKFITGQGNNDVAYVRKDKL